jgi:hypothetical protein
MSHAQQMPQRIYESLGRGPVDQLWTIFAFPARRWSSPDSPDPDSLASAYGIQALFQGVSAGRRRSATGASSAAERSRPGARLRNSVVPLQLLTLESFCPLVLVFAPQTGNNSLPPAPN